MPKIIHNPRELMNLNREELDELLLEEYKNSGLLRELVRVSLLQLKEQTELTEFYKGKKNNVLDKLDNIKHDINDIIEKYKYE